VIRPRLADAAFFYETDKKANLESRTERLKNIVFQAKLGTLFDKSNRIARLATLISDAIAGDAAKAQRAALLCKTDLVTEMVGEFSDLQGIMGKYYAANDGEDQEVAAALYEQYLPRYSGDDLPETLTGAAIALADRIDTLVGIFGINQPPSGSKDPFALRRAALGVIRIISEKQFANIDLHALIAAAIEQLGNAVENDNAQKDVESFIFDRYRAFYSDQGIPADTVQAVQATATPNPYDFDLRIKAVNHFRELDASQALAAANKRVSNILKKQSSLDGDMTVDTAKLTENAEQNLFNAISEQDISELCQQGQYTEALSQLAQLREPIDAFFDNVMVMVDDEAVKTNRINLLRQLYSKFASIADISVLQ